MRLTSPELALPAVSSRVIAQLTSELDNTTIAKVGVLEKKPTKTCWSRLWKMNSHRFLRQWERLIAGCSREIEASLPTRGKFSAEGTARITSFDPHQIGAIKGALAAALW